MKGQFVLHQLTENMEAPIFSEDPSRRQNKFKIWMIKFKKQWNFLRRD
jgi:hypothetical protein